MGTLSWLSCTSISTPSAPSCRACSTPPRLLGGQGLKGLKGVKKPEPAWPSTWGSRRVPGLAASGRVLPEKQAVRNKLSPAPASDQKRRNLTRMLFSSLNEAPRQGLAAGSGGSKFGLYRRRAILFAPFCACRIIL